MPSVLHAYRVFIASPAGMERERATFKAAINQHNESDAIERGVIFLPVGWELTPGGVGRPQQLINEDVRRCDFFVLVLGDRWGSAPQADPKEGFSSGSEEELAVATECYDQQTMRDLIVFFKTLPPEKLADPGDQLKPVLSFRKKLEAEKKLLFESFDELPTFRDKLQRHVSRWVRDHEQGQPRSRPHPVATRPATRPRSVRSNRQQPAGAATGSSAAVHGADKLAREGRMTEAGGVLARALLDDDLEAMHRYAALQAHAGDPSAAEAAFQRLRKVARAQGNVDWQVESLIGLAGVYASLDRSDDEEECYREALRIREAAFGPDHPEVAVSLNVLAEFYLTHERPQKALALLERAFEIQGVPVAS